MSAPDAVDSLDGRWDEIVVGGGSAGAVLASRLSEQPERRVLLLEAGPDFATLASTPTPIKNARAAVMGGYNWNFSADLRGSGLFQGLLQAAGLLATAPRDMLGTAHAALRAACPLADTMQKFPYLVGKVIGGSSAVNGALALRPPPTDFARWAALGNDQWDWPQVLPYFIKLEHDQDFSGPLHGGDGPVPVVRPRPEQLHDMQAAFRQTCLSLGMASIADLNAGGEAGVGALPANRIDFLRVSSAIAYLLPARARPNLRIVGDCTVNRVLFGGGHGGPRALGVEASGPGGRLRALHGARVTLCAGALNSVPILLRSGIGNQAQCRSLGLTPLLDLPGVGENLCDHPALMFWMVPKLVAEPVGASQLQHQIMARCASQPGQTPDLSLFALENFQTKPIPMLAALLKSESANAVSAVLTKPASRGRVFLNDAAPGAAPVIELNLLDAPEDLERLKHGARLAWKIARSPAIDEHVRSIFLWNQTMIDNERLLESAIKRFATATWHAVGTAKMGAPDDPMAVVDQHCRLHGATGLRIVDASVMPLIPGVPTNLTCMMLGERVAQWMLREGD